MWHTPHRTACAVMLVVGVAITPVEGHAQSRVGADSSTRTRRYTHNLGYGIALGFVYAGVDQLRDEPPEWGKGWHGYGRRLASNVGEFVIQETVTDIAAAVMNRPLDYRRCRCTGTGRKIGWALQSAVTDVLPDGHRALAVPRILGAYSGSFAQASWRPAASNGRVQTALVNGTVSLLIGAGINLYHELR